MPPKLQISAPLVSAPIPPPTSFRQFKSNPSRFIANWLYVHYQRIPSLSPSSAAPEDDLKSSISLVCISDTHNTTPSGIPNGDILLHAGDLTAKGTFKELQAQLDWINTLPHAHKIVIAGNHDCILDGEYLTNNPHLFGPGEVDRRQQPNWGGITYLNSISTTISIRGRRLVFFGSPLTPDCGNFAFQYPLIRDVWKDRIPDGTDVVLTHGPPKGHLDLGGKGCEWLLRELWRVRPRVVVCGHIHEGRGEEILSWDSIQKGYDFPGYLRVVVMALALGWSYVLRALEGRRKVRTVLVNAAVGSNEPVKVVRV